MTEDIFKSAVFYHSKKNFSKAKEIYESLLKTNPDNLAILQNYATLLSQLREYKKAENVFKKCLKIKSNDPLLLYNFGKCFHEQKIFHKAIEFYRRSFNIDPKNDTPLYNIGNIYLFQNKYEQAIEYFKKAIDINSSNYLAYNNIAIANKRLGNFDDAIKFYRHAIKKNNNYTDAHLNYGTMLLTLGQLEEGLEQYEWRKKSKSFLDYVEYHTLNLKSKVWDGQDLNNKKLFIIAEQGIGDLIQFSRYLYLIKKSYKVKITLKIKGESFLHFFDKNEFKVISENKDIPLHDYHIHMMSLLRIFYKKNNFFYKPVNFITRKKNIEEKWKNKLKDIKGIKIGINSTTSLKNKNIPLMYFIKLAKDLDCKFIMLQKKISTEDLKKISQNKNIISFSDFDEGNQAFIDSIAVINSLDLVITADTALAHLSATLGKKTWIALPFIADWRWFKDKKNTKWYNNVVLYRQEKNEDWDSVFGNIKKDIVELLNF